jgi:RND family efflux transporter MFP subunit
MINGKAKGQNEGEVRKNRKHKIKWIRIVVPLVIILFIVYTIISVGEMATSTMVYKDKIVNGDISTYISTSGNVVAENKKTFFAPTSVKVAEVEFEKGDIVNEGDIIICFDEESVEYAQLQNELDTKISSADYNSNIQYNNEQQQKLEQAEAKIVEYEQEIKNYNQYIDDLTNGISDETALRKTDLYAQIYSVQKAINEYDLAMQVPTEDTDSEELLRKKTEKQNELNQLNNELSMLSDYKTDYGWEDLLTQAKKDLSDYETKLSEAKSVKSSAEAAIANANKIRGYQLNNEKTQLTTSDASNKYDEALNGIVSEFNGVITDISVVEGASVSEGTQLVVVESLDDICVEFRASKYDLETLAIGQEVEVEISGMIYNGTVSKINHMAEQNSSGVPMVTARVHINNPDANIYLGIEAKIKIFTVSLENVLLAPVSAVSVDNGGYFCYIIDENGLLEKKYIQVGVSTEDYIQITDGLSEGDEIVTSTYSGIDLEEGMAVTFVEDSDIINE